VTIEAGDRSLDGAIAAAERREEGQRRSAFDGVPAAAK
jgi:hypothetical protein